MPPVAVAAVATAAAIGGTVYSVSQQRKAAKAQARASALDRQRMNLQSARERRDAIKAARQAYAASQTAAANQGASGTSGAEGALGSIMSQATTNLSFLDRYNVLTDQASEAIGQANSAQSRAATGGAIAELGWSVFSNSNKIAKIWG
jgi:uncharacterized protein HemX